MTGLDELFNEVQAAQIRTCTKCKNTYQLEEGFSWASLTPADKRNGARRRKAQCRYCDRKDFALWRGANLEEVQANDRAKHYSRKYGLDVELSKVLANPENRIGCCPLCRETERLVLDHDHRTGKVRDLICNQCNTMLGNARDNLDILYEAIAYLKKHRGV